MRREMTADSKKIHWLAVNLVLVLCESYLCYVLMFRRGTGFDLAYLLEYPNYANFSLFLSSWILIAGCIAELCGTKARAYYGFRLFRYMAVTASSLTFVVAVLIAFPMTGFDFIPYFESVNLLECIICPVLAYFSFTYLGDYSDFGKRETLLATLPGVLYNAVIVILNGVGVLDGPYSFQKADEQGIGTTLFWTALVVGGTFIIATVLLIVAQAHGPKVRRKGRKGRNRSAVENLEKTVDDEAETHR